MPLRLIKAACRYARSRFTSPVARVSLTFEDGRTCEFGCAPEPPTPPPKNRPRPAPAGGEPFGADARKILAAIAGRGPVEAKNVPAAAGVERSRSYVLLSDLAERGVVRETIDGYVLADERLRAHLLGGPS